MATLDQATANRIKDELTQAARAIAAKHGLIMHQVTGRYTPLDLKLNLKFLQNPTIGGNAQAPQEKPSEEAQRHFARLAQAIGLKASLNQNFVFNGYKFSIVGIKLNRPKFPVSAIREDGKPFKFPVNQIERCL